MAFRLAVGAGVRPAAKREQDQEIMNLGWILVVVAVVVVAVVMSSLRVLREYERGVAFRLGRLRPLLEPGVRPVLFGVDKMIRVDLRVVTLTIPPQEVITKDNVPARVNAVVMFTVTDPVRAVMTVENFAVATSQIAQTTLRSVVGRADLDTLLAHRQDLNEDLRASIANQTDSWGIAVQVVEIKDVEIPEAMQRAMAREAEAERERRAKVINARGELQASEELRQAADVLSASPASLQLRYLQTLLELGADQNSTVVFPLPLDIVGRPGPEAGRHQRCLRQRCSSSRAQHPDPDTAHQPLTLSRRRDRAQPLGTCRWRDAHIR
jgi:regulator of protease activity HflC (stomatin/prohibitin superfamily)